MVVNSLEIFNDHRSKLPPKKLFIAMLNHFMRLANECKEESSDIDFASLGSSLECDHVEFSHKDLQLSLFIELNMKINPSQKVGIIGNMGSGTSSLSRLFAGVYTPRNIDGFIEELIKKHLGKIIANKTLIISVH